MYFYMWTCPSCNRNFYTQNQSHTCSQTQVGELFQNKSDELVLAFDGILCVSENWKPNTYGADKHSIVFHSKRAWLIVKPKKKELDLKFYYDSEIESELLHKTTNFSENLRTTFE